MSTRGADRARVDEPRVIVVCGLDFEAAIAAGPGVATVLGPGPRRVLAGLDALVAAQPQGARAFSGILSFGCAGGLDPGLRPGDCVVGSGVIGASGRVGADAAWTQALAACLPSARQGWLAGLDAPLAQHDAKARLWRDGGALAVDMESHAAARAAQRHRLPFAALRVVLDPAWRSLPDAAVAAMREDGGTDLAALLRALARSPGEIVPLIALALDAWHARRALRRVRALAEGALAPPDR
ncbi:phosphorylase [Massilia sp. 9096]|uniref:phosphorylase n=1 Tax=Massilia sp. 9096 TaxID=1500894 RepID=UPI00068C5FAE|nr:phosphorylase [Massilia sp. 9096]